jgi:hypothetical protein
MGDTEYYREEARRCREWAAAAADPKDAEQLLCFAADFAALAAIMEEGGPAPSLTTPMQQQPVPQEQQTKEEDK